jgi:hypothetical protein
MRKFCVLAAVGLSLIGGVSSASAQFGGGYRERDYDRDYDRRGRDYDDRGSRYGRGGGGGFDEREYLRCNRDVLRSVQRGETASGFEHYRIYGRREGRRLSC